MRWSQESATKCKKCEKVKKHKNMKKHGNVQIMSIAKMRVQINHTSQWFWRGASQLSSERVCSTQQDGCIDWQDVRDTMSVTVCTHATATEVWDILYIFMLFHVFVLFHFFTLFCTCRTFLRSIALSPGLS